MVSRISNVHVTELDLMHRCKLVQAGSRLEATLKRVVMYCLGAPEAMVIDPLASLNGGYARVACQCGEPLCGLRHFPERAVRDDEKRAATRYNSSGPGKCCPVFGGKAVQDEAFSSQHAGAQQSGGACIDEKDREDQ